MTSSAVILTLTFSNPAALYARRPFISSRCDENFHAALLINQPLNISNQFVFKRKIVPFEKLRKPLFL